MTHFSRKQAGELEWASAILFLAALYNLVWGLLAAAAPLKMLALVGVNNAGYAGFWQCIGMFVALYGVGYWFASTDPARYWPFVLIGLTGKILGPVGAVVAIASGSLPPAFLWVNATNDVLWWAPFAWVLWVVRRWNVELVPVAGEERPTALYRRVLGLAFDDLMPRVRNFHNTTRRVEVRGAFRVTRGSSRLGNWLTDLAGFPRPHEALEVSLVVEPVPEGEIWQRSFDGTTIESLQFEAHGFLAERFGPLVLYLQPRVSAGALKVRDVRSTFFGVPLPPYLAPKVDARGIDTGAGIDVEVRISCLPLGLLVEYKGVVA